MSKIEKRMEKLEAKACEKEIEALLAEEEAIFKRLNSSELDASEISPLVINLAEHMAKRFGIEGQCKSEDECSENQIRSLKRFLDIFPKEYRVKIETEILKGIEMQRNEKPPIDSDYKSRLKKIKEDRYEEIESICDHFEMEQNDQIESQSDENEETKNKYLFS